jgi:hypothetical protein
VLLPPTVCERKKNDADAIHYRMQDRKECLRYVIGKIIYCTVCTVKWDDVSDFGVSEGCMICCYAVIGSRGNGGVEGGILEKGGYLGKVKGLKLYHGK